MGFLDILIIVVLAVGVIGAGLFFLNRWASKKISTQQNLMDKNRQPASIYIIDKKRDRAANVNLPKVVMDNLPRAYKFMKMNFVKAKIGPQIMTLICDKHIFNGLQAKKTYQVELAGIYIASAKGVKTKQQLKEQAKAKKKAAKETVKETKAKK